MRDPKITYSRNGGASFAMTDLLNQNNLIDELIYYYYTLNVKNGIELRLKGG